jgi:hypothetical protein
MPITFLLIPTAFVLFGAGYELARMTSPSHRKASARCIADMNPRTISLPQREASTAFKDALALPLGFGRGEFSFGDSLLSHAANCFAHG